MHPHPELQRSKYVTRVWRPTSGSTEYVFRARADGLLTLMATYLNGEQFWHFCQRRPPASREAIDGLLRNLSQSSGPPPVKVPAARSRPQSAPVASVRLPGFPRVSAEARDHRDLLKQRRQELMHQSAKVHALLRSLPEEAPIKAEGRQPSTKSGYRNNGVYAGASSAPKGAWTGPRGATSKAGSSRVKRGGTWTIPSTAQDLPTFSSHGVWSAMTYLEFDGKGLVPKRGGVW